MHGCREQDPVNREVEKVSCLKIEETDAVKNPEYVKEYTPKVTPAIIILQDGTIRERFGGVVHPEPLKKTL